MKEVEGGHNIDWRLRGEKSSHTCLRGRAALVSTTDSSNLFDFGDFILTIE